VGEAWERADGKVLADGYAGRPERESRVAATLIYAPNRSLRIEGRAGISEFTDFEHTIADMDGEPFTLVARLSW
jgi:hypothetical protein